jgi:hypothetical protein
MWRTAATLFSVEDFAGQSLAERLIHYTCIGGLRQAPNQDAVPAVGLIEKGLRQSDGTKRIVQVPMPGSTTGHGEDHQRLLPTHDSSASAPSDTDEGTPAAAPSRAPESGSSGASAASEGQ